MSHSSRRLAAAAIAAGLASAAAGVVGMVSAQAASGAPGSNFGAVDISATAAGLRMPLYSHGGEDVENESPWSEAQLQSGGDGHALTTVYWPGGTGGHGGSTLALLAPSCLPPNPQGVIPTQVPCVVPAPSPPPGTYDKLNDPYKAEAQTSAGKSTVTNHDNPAVTMTATALSTDVKASTTVQGQKLPGVGDVFGATSAATRIHVTGPNLAVIDASSTLHDVSLGGGVITISSLSSVVHATSNGSAATGAGHTTVQGMKVMGTPVVIDEKGIHVAGQGSSLPSTKQLNDALAQSGFQIYVAAPSRTVKGPAVSVFSGNLIIRQANPQYTSQANDSGIIFTLGGATVVANTGLGYPYTPPPPVTGQPSSPPVPVPPASGGGGSTISTGGGSLPPATTGGGGGAPPPAVATPPAAAPPFRTVAQPLKLFGGLGVMPVVLVLLGAGLAAAGLKRLPDRVLSESGPACSAGDST